MIGETSMTGPVDGIAGLGYVLIPHSGLGGPLDSSALSSEFFNVLGPQFRAATGKMLPFGLAEFVSRPDYWRAQMPILIAVGQRADVYDSNVLRDQSGARYVTEAVLTDYKAQYDIGSPVYSAEVEALHAQTRAKELAEAERVNAGIAAQAQLDKVAVQSPTYVDPYTLPQKDYQAWYAAEVAKITAAPLVIGTEQPGSTIQPTSVQSSVAHNDCPSGQVLDPQLGLCTWRNWDTEPISMQAESILSKIPGPTVSAGGFNIPWLAIAGVAAVGLFAFSGKRGR